jgi:serine phosphatase RsbU (regulator of sigma subunit)
MARRNSAGGMGLATRFALIVGVGLIVVGVGFALVFTNTATQLANRTTDEWVERSLELTAAAQAQGLTGLSSNVERRGEVRRRAARLADGTSVVQLEVGGNGEPLARLVAPPGSYGLEDVLLRLVLPLTAVMVGAGVLLAVYAGRAVTRPIPKLIDLVRDISHGRRTGRVNLAGAGELAHLGHALERMAEELEEARETELELSIRDRELELAAEVRLALLPLATPFVEGVDLAAFHLPAAELAGAFHDFIELPEGRVGCLVCDVSGEGAPAAIVGAMARAALRSSLSRVVDYEGDELDQAFATVNRELASSLPRGHFATALYAVLDPAQNRAIVACAGHRVPLLRYSASDGQLRSLQPEGLALGLDGGPIFERSLVLQDLEFEPGDRLVLATQGACAVPQPDGGELGERGLYKLVAHHAKGGTRGFLKGVRLALQRALDPEDREAGFERAISLVTIVRDGNGESAG